MTRSRKDRPFPVWRLLVLGFLFILGGVFILSNLRRIQIEEQRYFMRDQDRQSIRRVQVPGRRGRILDRHETILAECRPDYCILLYPDELRRPGAWSNTVNAVEAQMRHIADVLGIQPQISRRRIQRHLNETPYMPIIAFRHVNEEAQAILSERFEEFTGAVLMPFPERFYPFDHVAAQVIGYTGRSEPKVPEGETRHCYLPDMEGRAGLERQYNSILTGRSGMDLVRIDSRGYRHELVKGEPAQPGSDIHTTLDIALQQTLERAFGERRGSVVVMNPTNGEVLAMVSRPSYNNNDMVPAPSADFWKSLMDPLNQQPLLNRAVQGLYPPGSTFKPFTAIAALQAGISTNWHHTCEGRYVIRHTRIRCWNTYGHGELNLHDALEHSCNPYFCHLAQQIGYDAIEKVGVAMGLGQRTGIDLPAEMKGLLPTAEWKKRTLGQAWHASDTSLIAIGQGTLLVTPLQMAVATSALANGGRIVQPHLLLNAEIPPPRATGWREQDLQTVQEGMVAVVQYGSGRRVAIPGVEVAAKTGTAEYDRNGERRKFTWMIAYAPVEAPRVAVAVVVEDGESGGLTAAPLARKALVTALGLPDDAPTEAISNGAVSHD